MPRTNPLHWKVVECIFVKDGYVFYFQMGTHAVYVKRGVNRPLIIPTIDSIEPDIIDSLRRSSKMPRETYFRLLAECS